MDQKQVIDKLIQYKNNLINYIDFEKIYLFGSYARNSNKIDSDIDVAIIVKNYSENYFTITPLLWKLRRDIDLRIEPILLERDNDHAGFIEDIESYGIEI